LTLTKDSARTINRRIGSVQAFLKHCHEKGAVSDYVLKKYPKRNVKGTEKRKCRHLTEAEVKALIRHAPDERKDIYRFALLTGFRFSEVKSMTPANFNLQQNTVTVQASDAKNKKRHQTIPLHPELKKLVAARIKGKAADAKIFDMPERTDAARLLRADCETAKIDPARIMFHSLRHTYITRLAESNIHPKILQTLARHSSLETTLNYYVHFRQADERSAIAAMAA
jgi:integrase